MNMFKVEEGRSPRLASPVPSTAPVVATPEGLNRTLTAVIEMRCKEYHEITRATPSVRNLLVYIHSCSNEDHMNGNEDRREIAVFTGFRWTSLYHSIFNLNGEN
jgi:hypothetical protein